MALVAARGGGSAAALVKPVLADMTAWSPPGGPGSVDAVVLSFCHMRADDRPKVMAAVVEWLKPGARVGYGDGVGVGMRGRWAGRGLCGCGACCLHSAPSECR